MEGKEMKWLRSRQGMLKVDRIEKELGLSQGTISKFLRNERGLTKEVEKSVIKWVKDFQL